MQNSISPRIILKEFVTNTKTVQVPIVIGFEDFSLKGNLISYFAFTNSNDIIPSIGMAVDSRSHPGLTNEELENKCIELLVEKVKSQLK